MLPRDFPRSARLLDGRDYDWVFAAPKRCRDRYFTVLYRRRPTRERARLGLAVSRKVDRRAVVRNRIKRLVRESFRIHQAQLAGMDAVVIAKPGSGHCGRVELTRVLVRHWQKIAPHDLMR